jgi:hypothetical protein
VADTNWDSIQAEIANGVGAVANASAYLEFTMYQLYCRLVGSPLAEIVAIGEGFVFYFERSRNLLRFRSDMTDMEAQDVWLLLDRVKTLMEDRNHVIHGVWMPTSAGGSDQDHEVLLNRRGLRTPIKRFSARRMHEIAEAMEGAALEIHESVLDIFEGQFLDWDDESRSPGVLRRARNLPLPGGSRTGRRES